jgi:hypothetical protein
MAQIRSSDEKQDTKTLKPLKPLDGRMILEMTMECSLSRKPQCTVRVEAPPNFERPILLGM